MFERPRGTKVNNLKILIGLIFAVFLLPLKVDAALIINEIAWMGTLNSANDEWIELYNDSDVTIDLEGYKLSNGDSLDINLSGKIKANEYAVLERTDDSTLPSVSALVIYTGAMSNNGETLILKDPKGNVIDQVYGGKDWEQVGGDNETKYTAQYDVSGWFSGKPTPGYENKSQITKREIEDSDSEDEGDEETSNTTKNKIVKYSSSDYKNNENISLKEKDHNFEVTIIGPDNFSKGKEVSFKAKASGLGEAIIPSVIYTWNLGDMETATGSSVTHTYEHAGQYVLHLEAKFKDHKANYKKIISVLPIKIELVRHKDGFIQIQNNAGYPIDISSYKIKTDKIYKIPKQTYLALKSTLIIKDKTISNYLGPVVLFDNQGHQLDMLESYLKTKTKSKDTKNKPVTIISKPKPKVARVSNEDDFQFATDSNLESLNIDTFNIDNQSDKTINSDFNKDNLKDTSKNNNSIPENSWHYLGLFLIITLALFSLYIGKLK